jgi:diaminohydroxyphosphoribosylaminopyrimidine deaminase/5-amino-6-(5-phosphoribosylamino)uracil reductase
VVAACHDPNPQVARKGVRQLRDAGIAVDVGVLEAEGKRLNEGYVKRVETGLPFVTLKAAMSLDGKIATAAGESQWITGEKARAVGHRLRAQHDVILSGIGTVLADDPELTVRLVKGRTPLRVVADSEAQTPPTARLLSADERPPIIAVTRQAPARRVQRLEQAGATVWTLPARGGQVDLRALMERLVAAGANRVLVEAGGSLNAGVLEAGLVDRVYFFIAPVLIGGAEALTPVEGKGVRALAEAWRLGSVRVRRVGEEMVIVGDLAQGRRHAC